PLRREQRAVLEGIEATVIQRFALERADRFAVLRAAGEHQRGVGRGMGAEDWEHGALVVRPEMKEAVPASNPSKRRSSVSVRMSATTHVPNGKRSAHRRIMGAELSTPVITRPRSIK